MDFLKDQFFECALANLVKLNNPSKSLPKNLPTIVWRINDKIVSGNVLQYSNTAVLEYPEFDCDKISQTTLASSKNGEKLLESVRFSLRDLQPENPTKQIPILISSPMLLFDKLKSYSQNADLSGIKPIGNKIYNVKFLENSSKENTLELPFLELSDSDYLDPISLISKN